VLAAVGLALILMALVGVRESRPALAAVEATIRVAVIGDYGAASRSAAEATAESAVATQVAAWSPDYVVTTGDNNYPAGAAGTIDANIGRFYHRYIYPYTGAYGAGAIDNTNRFFPSLGNHDYLADIAQPYVDYFALPGNERYYQFEWGPIHWFMLDVDPILRGVEISTTQALWLEQGLSASTARWQIVVMHHPPFSSGLHGSYPELQWPYAAWGADAVLSGHDHDYERIVRGGLVYFVNGGGGAALYPLGPPFTQPISGSQARFWNEHGAMLIEANDKYLRFQFVTTTGQVVDSYALGWPTAWLPLIEH
jgi:hypothetical protein